VKDGAQRWHADYLKTKENKIKNPLVHTEEMTNYYRTKLHTSDILRNPHPGVVLCQVTQ